MKSTFSQTQLENFAKAIGFVLMLSGHQVDDTAIDGFLITVGAFVGGCATLWSYIRRYKKGDVSLAGIRKV